MLLVFFCELKLLNTEIANKIQLKFEKKKIKLRKKSKFNLLNKIVTRLVCYPACA